MTEYRVVTYRERPDLLDAAQDITGGSWPEFMLHDAVANRLWDRLADDFPDFQFMLIDAGDTIMAVGNSIPLRWDGQYESLPDDGWDWVMQRGVDDFDGGVTPNTLSAISITIPLGNRGQGISRLMVETMRGIARAHGFADLIAPVRPNQKHLYPLTPIDRYVTWTADGEAPFDAWMRVHWRLGARVVKPCPRAMRMEGSVATWTEWTGMRFPDTGPYVVPDALVPVEIDVEGDLGVYVEPNVWMHHRLDAKAGG